MLKAIESAPYRGGLVKCALVAGLLLWALPAQSQEQIACGPAEALREFIEGEGLKKTASVALADGDMLEAWESDTRIALTILIRDPAEPTRCLIKTLGVNRKGRGA